MAQFGRALRSGRRGRVFESRRLDSIIHIRPVGQAVKTTPSHGVNPGSIPGQVTKKRFDFRISFFVIANIFSTKLDLPLIVCVKNAVTL